MSRLEEDGVPRENVLFLNFFGYRLAGLRHEGLAAVTEAYFPVYPEKKGRETVHGNRVVSGRGGSAPWGRCRGTRRWGTEAPTPMEGWHRRIAP